MDNEKYKKALIQMVKESTNLEWIKAVYTFAKNYPNRKNRKE